MSDLNLKMLARRNRYWWGGALASGVEKAWRYRNQIKGVVRWAKENQPTLSYPQYRATMNSTGLPPTPQKDHVGTSKQGAQHNARGKQTYLTTPKRKREDDDGDKPKVSSKRRKNNNGGRMPRKNNVSKRKSRPGKKKSKSARRTAKKFRNRLKKTTKKMRRNVKHISTNGPIGETHFFVPNSVAITGKENEIHDVGAATFSAKGNLASLAGKQNWNFVPILSREQFHQIAKLGELATEKSYLIDSYKGLFDPAPIGVETALGAAVGTAKNYFKTGEHFVIQKMDVALFITNSNTVPCRLWIDHWKKNRKVSKTSSGVTSPDVPESIYKAYGAQDYFQELGAHPTPTQANLFKDPVFDPKKLRGLTENWNFKSRKEFYVEGGAELRVDYQFRNMVYDGEFYKQNSTDDTKFMPGLSQMFGLCIRGITGKDTVSAGQYSAANLTFQVRCNLKGYRQNIFNVSPRSYVVNSALPMVAPVGAVTTYAETLTAYT